MRQFTPAAAAMLVAPSDQDWIVSFRMDDGSVVHRRVSPPTMESSDAVRRAALTLGAHRHRVVDASTRRHGDRRIVISEAT